MQSNSYRIKPGTTSEDIIDFGAKPGGIWISKDSEYYLSKYCRKKLERTYAFEFTIYISFPKDLSQWNDFDNILVLDEDFGQPYTPFYGDNYKKEISNFPCLEFCIAEYNKFLDSIPFFEKVKDN